MLKTYESPFKITNAIFADCVHSHTSKIHPKLFCRRFSRQNASVDKQTIKSGAIVRRCRCARITRATHSPYIFRILQATVPVTHGLDRGSSCSDAPVDRRRQKDLRASSHRSEHARQPTTLLTPAHADARLSCTSIVMYEVLELAKIEIVQL